MELWKKTFLMSFSIVLLVLFSAMTILDCVIFSDSYHQGIKSASTEKSMVQSMVKNQLAIEGAQSETLTLSNSMRKNGQYFSLKDESEKLIISSLPFEFQETIFPDMRLHKVDGTPYFVITSLINVDDTYYAFTYAKDASGLYAQSYKNLGFLFGSTMLLALVLGLILYFSLKKVYTPINNIAHELRTPLTGIQGYSQLLISASLTEKEKVDALEQILTDSTRLKSIVEKLLIMGNLREGNISMKVFDFPTFLEELKGEYPSLVIENAIEEIKGNKRLLTVLFTNLLSNAYQNGDCVKITGDNNKIEIWNNGEVLSEYVLAQLNQRQGLRRETFDGHGYGVRLCHEIVKLHKGKLIFTSEKGKGTTVTILFSKYHIKNK